MRVDPGVKPCLVRKMGQMSGLERGAESMRSNAGLLQKANSRRAIIHAEQAAALRRDAFARQARCRRGRVAKRGGGGGVDACRPETWQEAAIAQHAERIFFHPLRGISGKTQGARFQIGTSAQRVVNLAVGINIDGVDGEVPARRVCLPVVTESDHRMPAVGLEIDPGLRHLDGPAYTGVGRI